MNIGLIPQDKYYLNNQIFTPEVGPYFSLKKELRERKINVETIDRFENPYNLDALIYFETPLRTVNYSKLYKELPKHFKGKKILFLFEAPVILPQNYSKQNYKYFDYIFTWDDDLVDNKKFLKSFWPQTMMDARKLEEPFGQKKLLTLMNANKSSFHKDELYTKRREAINYFEKNIPRDFDLYGRGWNKHVNIPLYIVLWNTIKRLNIKIIRSHLQSFITPKSYRGVVADKMLTLCHYKFNLCFENMTGIKGYITEKIWDSFKAKVVPIYLGADNITDFVPKNCFIDFRDFNNYHLLLDFMNNMSEKTYLKYIKNIDYFMKSKKALKWFDDYWGREMAIKISDIISL